MPKAKTQRASAAKPADAAIESADRQAAASVRSTGTVSIGCKLPHGIVLELFEQDEPGVTRHFSQPPRSKGKVILKGANSLRTNPRAHQGVHPYAITEVDASFWREWISNRDNSQREFIAKGLVFEAPNRIDAQAMAKERRRERTGLEGLNPTVQKDPRMPKAANENAQVETDAEALKKLQVAAA